MPNHISNLLRVSYYGDDKERLATILKEIGSEDNPFDFNKFFQYPEYFQVLDDASEAYLKEHPDDWKGKPTDGYNQGGYEWCRGTWGTKWNSYDHNMRVNRDYMFALYFETAWSWPRPIIYAFLERYSDVEVEHLSADEGGGFASHLSRKDGEPVKLIEWNPRDHEDIIDAIWQSLRG